MSVIKPLKSQGVKIFRCKPLDKQSIETFAHESGEIQKSSTLHILLKTKVKAGLLTDF